MAGLGLTGFIAASGQDLSYIFQKWDGVTPVAQETKYLTTLSGALATSKDLNQIFQPFYSMSSNIDMFTISSGLTYTYYYNNSTFVIMILAGSGTIIFNKAGVATVSLVGGGGGANSASGTNASFGGAGSGAAVKLISLNNGINYNVTIGNGGLGSSSSVVSGSNGGTSYFNDSSSTNLTAPGGNGPSITLIGNPGLGTSAWGTGGDTNYLGHPGGGAFYGGNAAILFSPGHGTTVYNLTNTLNSGGTGYGGGGGGGILGVNAGKGGNGSNGGCVISIHSYIIQANNTGFSLNRINVDLNQVFLPKSIILNDLPFTPNDLPFTISTTNSIKYGINYSNGKYSIYLNNNQPFNNTINASTDVGPSGNATITFTANIKATVMMIGGGGRNMGKGSGGGSETLFLFDVSFNSGSSSTFNIASSSSNTSVILNGVTYTANKGNNPINNNYTGSGGSYLAQTNGGASHTTQGSIGNKGIYYTPSPSSNIVSIGGGSGTIYASGGNAYGYSYVNNPLPLTKFVNDAYSTFSYPGRFYTNCDGGGMGWESNGIYGGGANSYNSGSVSNYYGGCGYVGITFAYP